MTETTWTKLLDGKIRAIAEQCSTHEGRKQFRADDGPARVRGMIQTLSAFASRLSPYDNP